MKYIYIKNYLNILKQRKEYFTKFIKCYDEFYITKQKILLNANSLLLEFNDISDIDFAKLNISNFFEKDKGITVTNPKDIIFEKDCLTLVFKNNNKEKIEI